MIFGLLCAIPVLSTAADDGAQVRDLSFDQCELRAVVMRMKFESIKNSGAIAEQTISVLKPIEAINSKATNPNKPIGEQLSPEDIGKFTELTQRLKTMQLAQLVESRRERDAKAIEQMVMMADREWRWQDVPNEKDQNYIIYASYKLLGLMFKDHQITTPSSSVCSLDVALHRVENEAITKLNANSARLDSATVELNSLLAKYGITQIDRSRMSKDDVKRVDQLIKDVINPLNRHADFAKDIESIKTMARASEILYQTTKQDIAFSGGNPDALGRTVQKQIQDNELDERTKIAVGLWGKINEKIPSDFIREFPAIRDTPKK